jgi:hypothetical protein
MQGDFPIFERRVDDILRTFDILPDILGGSLLRVRRIRDRPGVIELKHIHEDGVNLLKSARLFKDARIIDALKERLPDSAICEPEREEADFAAY